MNRRLVKIIMYPDSIPSPLLPETASARLVETRSTERIAELYLTRYGYDASEDFAALPEIAVYECEVTRYRFFYPYTLEGKERLYRKIEDHEWTYQEGKWEHEAVLQRIPKEAAVLDVGCGRGAFLAKVISSRTKNATGIELNRSAAAFTRNRGIPVVESLIKEHARECPSTYDVVTAFQVLEHIADPLPFLIACISALKVGGLLVLAVPNNAAFLQFDNDDVLNAPPHHVGLWTPASLGALPSILPIELQSLEEEALREVDWYRQVMEQRYLPKRWQRSIYYRLGGQRIFHRYLIENVGSISGHTVIGFYRRLESQK